MRTLARGTLKLRHYLTARDLRSNAATLYPAGEAEAGAAGEQPAEE
jgi:hypothetical protein